MGKAVNIKINKTRWNQL